MPWPWQQLQSRKAKAIGPAVALGGCIPGSEWEVFMKLPLGGWAAQLLHVIVFLNAGSQLKKKQMATTQLAGFEAQMEPFWCFSAPSHHCGCFIHFQNIGGL